MTQHQLVPELNRSRLACRRRLVVSAGVPQPGDCTVGTVIPAELKQDAPLSGCLLTMSWGNSIPQWNCFVVLLRAAHQSPEPGAGSLREGRARQGHLRTHFLLAGEQG